MNKKQKDAALTLAVVLGSLLICLAGCSDSRSGKRSKRVKEDSVNMWNNFNTGLVRTKILSTGMYTYTILNEQQSQVLYPTDTVYLDIITHKIVDVYEETPEYSQDINSDLTVVSESSESAPHIQKAVLFNKP